jgi:uncharacterized protein YrrD
MHKVSELIDKPIVSADSGDRIGKVADVLLDPSSQRVVALVVAGGLLSAEQVLPYSDVQTLGTDAVVARTGAGVVGPKEWRQQAVETRRASTLNHTRVLTTSGRAVGEIRDVVLDDDGAVDAFEVAGSSLRGLLQRRSTLPSAHGVTVGADAVLVPDETVDAMEQVPKSQ